MTYISGDNVVALYTFDSCTGTVGLTGLNQDAICPDLSGDQPSTGSLNMGWPFGSTRFEGMYELRLSCVFVLLRFFYNKFSN